jgi:hypothetical protein
MGSINRKFERYSEEIREIMHEQNTVVDALKDESLAGITANKLYSLCKPGYVPRLDLSYISQKLKNDELPRLLETIRDLEHGCKTFDDPNFPWASRKNFSNLDLNDKHKATKTLDQIIELSKKQEAIFVPNSSDQKALVSSIDSLGDLNTSGGGRFRKLFSGGKERAIRENIQRLIDQSNISEDVINDPNISDLGRRARIGVQIWDAFSGLSDFLSEDAVNNLAMLLKEGNHNLLISTFTKMRGSLDSFFYDLQAYDRKKSELNPIEKEILQMCMECLPIEDKNSRWDEVLRQDFYFHWINHIEQKHPELKGQPFEKYMANRDRLSKLINEHQALVTHKILSQIDDSIIRPEITSSQSNRLYKARYDQWNTLLEELNKRRHLLPIRKMVENYGPIILRIAPCWLATPAAVSSIFPLKKTLFDYVIFDEASQSNVANSLPALERGMHSVIIGDEKQLPPIDHFRIKEDYDEEDSNSDIDIDRALFSENILLLASRVFNHVYLTWHYRSVYQELIDFSNHAFYDSRLKVVANVTKNVFPIRWVTCNNGSWVNYRNKQEAVLVVDELKNILIKNKKDGLHRSVGIITFNSNQQDEISEEIERRKQQDPEFGELYSVADDEGRNLLEDLPFVRNIERVQGEERDIIIFSTGYAKDSDDKDDGSMRVRFGSLDKRDGEHYLNVAVTRAREQIIVVSSFDPRRIDAENATHDGPRRFKDYLCFAKAISEHNFEEAKKILSSLNSNKYENVDKLDNAEDDSLEKSVNTELQKLGYNVDLHIGHSDYKINLAVVHPDLPSRYILAIEFDGKSFLNAPSTKEKDVTRQAFLESKRWAVEWVWSKNWWMNRDKEIARIRQRIEDLRSIQRSHRDLYDKLPVRNYPSNADEQKYEESLKAPSSLVSPDKPFTNKVIMWNAIKSCEDYICWVDKYFSKVGFELLVQSLDRSKIKNIKILTSVDKVDERLKVLFKDFKDEMKYSQVVCEMRVIVDSKLLSDIHDRWIISKNISYNIPSTDVVARGQYSEVNKTENATPFDDWWNNSIDILGGWTKIQNIKDRIQNIKK